MGALRSSPEREKDLARKDPNRSRRLDIQGLRAIAVLMVIAFHAHLPVPGGFVGVDVFFVISGFVITAMLLREHQLHGRIRFARFYLRRFKRLTPALALVLTVTLLGSFLFVSPLGDQQNVAKTALGAVFLSANVVISLTTGDYFDAPAESNPLLHTWSLAVEEQFYLVFPLILAVCWVGMRKWKRRAIPVAGVTVVAVVSFLAAILGPIAFPTPVSGHSRLAVLFGFYSPVTRAWEFAAGALVALLIVSGHRLPIILTRTSGVLGAAGLLASVWLINGGTLFPGPWTLLPVGASVLLLVSGSGEPNGVTRLLGSRPMTWIGDLSYSWYLWHWPFIVFAASVWRGVAWAPIVAGVVSIVPAYASYRWVEEPIRSMSITSFGKLAKVAVATLLPPFLLAGSLGFMASNQYWSPKVATYLASQQSAADVKEKCDGARPIAQRAVDCLWNAAAQGEPIFLVGDSNAGHFSEAFIGAASELDRPLVIATYSACPLVEGFLDRHNRPKQAELCRSQIRETLDYLAAHAPITVALSSADHYWTSPEWSYGASPATASTDTPTKLASFETNLQETVEDLQAAGHRVVLIQTIPAQPGSEMDPTSCSLIEMVSEAGCQRSMDVQTAMERQSGPREALVAVAQRTGAVVIDPGPEICPGGTCLLVSDGMIRYRNSMHLTVAQSRDLAGFFAEALR